MKKMRTENNIRRKELMDYVETLLRLKRDGFKCDSEMQEVLKELHSEMGFSEKTIEKDVDLEFKEILLTAKINTLYSLKNREFVSHDLKAVILDLETEIDKLKDEIISLKKLR